MVFLTSVNIADTECGWDGCLGRPGWDGMVWIGWQLSKNPV